MDAALLEVSRWQRLALELARANQQRLNGELTIPRNQLDRSRLECNGAASQRELLQ
jgi:hypothetical protein